MIIKNNEEIANNFLKQFNNYGLNIQEVKDYYSRRNKDFMNEIKLGKKTLDEYDDFFKNNDIEEKKALDKEKEKNKEVEQGLRELLKNMTQEMLVTLYKKTNNRILKEEIFNQISSNNIEIENFNTIYLRSGEIFGIIESMTPEEVEKTLLLRESNDKIEVIKDNISNYKIELQSLSTTIVEYLVKKKIGLDLSDEKEAFCKKNGIEDEIQFELHKKMITNEYIQEQAKEAQEILNSILGKEDDSIIKLGESSMSGVTMFYPGRKL